MELLDKVVIAVMALVPDLTEILRIDASFDPLVVTVSRAKYKPCSLRERSEESPVEIGPETREIVERAIRAFSEIGRTETRRWITLSLTVHGNGQYSFGGSRHE